MFFLQEKCDRGRKFSAEKVETTKRILQASQNPEKHKFAIGFDKRDGAKCQVSREAECRKFFKHRDRQRERIVCGNPKEIFEKFESIGGTRIDEKSC